MPTSHRTYNLREPQKSSGFDLPSLAQNSDRRHERKNRADSSGPNERKEPGMVRKVQLHFPLAPTPDTDSEGRCQSHPSFRQPGWRPEAINSLYEAAHYSISPCNRPTKARLDCFSLVFEIPVFRTFDPRTILFQKFSQSLKRRPSSPSALSIGFEFVQ
jgi:hypothetical protein